MATYTGVLLSVLATAVVAVKVDFYFEFGCPVCGQMLGGDTAAPSVMQQVANVPGVVVALYPFGNSFYASQTWGGVGAAPTEASTNPDPRYTVAARKGWDAACGLEVPQRQDSLCFIGDPICQHGPAACSMMSYGVCGKKAAGANWQQALTFMTCLDTNLGKGLKFGWPTGTTAMLVQDCAKKSTLDFASLQTCVAGEGKLLLQSEGKLTPAHSLIPYVLVDGVPADTTQLLAIVQAASVTTPAPVTAAATLAPATAAAPLAPVATVAPATGVAPGPTAAPSQGLNMTMIAGGVLAITIIAAGFGLKARWSGGGSTVRPQE